MENEIRPTLTTAEDGRSIRIGSDVLSVRALTGVEDGVVVLETTAAPGEPAPLDHIHRSYDEVFYVIDGEFEIRIDDQVVRAQTGAMVSVPRGTAHTFKNSGTADGRMMIIGAPGRAAQMLEDIGAMVASPGPLDPDALARVYERHDTVLVPPLSSDAVGT